MFERMTDRARRVLVLAQEEARFLNHSHIGTEHILLGLVNEGEGVGYQALVRHGMSSETARERVREIIGEGVEAPSGHIPFTPRAKKVFELSLREAIQLGHNYIGTEHLLLGLVREGGGVGAQVLSRLGLELAPLRQTVLQLLKEHPENQEAARRPWPRMERTPLCLHPPESLRYQPIEIAGEVDQPLVSAILVIC
ncbi:MAG: Clp protease N-terminal domain-containing protein, partial [Acidimicrobiia bacterium]